MSSLRVSVLLLVVLVACDKKKAEPKADTPVVAKPDDKGRAKPDDKGSGKPDDKPDAKAGSGSAKPDDGSAKADPMAGWTERKGAGFSVIAPQDPQVDAKQINATGKPAPAQLYTRYVPDGPGALQVMSTDVDPKTKADPKKVFDAMEAAMLRQFSATIRKKQDIEVGGSPGREVWVDGEHPQMGKLGVHLKFVLTKTRLYLVQSLYQADATDFAAQGDKFVESFKLQ